MAKNELNVEVNAALKVDRRTAECCLKLVEIYIHSSPVKLLTRHTESGETELYFAPDSFTPSKINQEGD